MKILITGGSGFIGSYIIDHLHPKHDLYVIGRSQEKKCAESIKGKKVPYYTTDYSESSIDEIFKKLKPEAVIHLAAQKPLSQKVLATDYIDNLYVSLTLFETCLKYKVSNIVNFSSRSVYSVDNSIPWKEDIKPIATNEYGLSKLWVDDAVRYYNTKGLKVKSLRIAQVIGIGERSGFVLQSYLKNALEGKSLKVYGKNLGKRQYIYSKDIALAVDKAINRPEKSGIFNIGMTDNYSFYELAQVINEVFNNKAGIEHLENMQADENQYLMCTKKAQKELNWQPEFDLYKTYLDIKKDLHYLQ